LDRLISNNTLVDEDGIFTDSEIPVSSLDITEEILKDVEKYFIPGAYRTICQSGKLIRILQSCRGHKNQLYSYESKVCTGYSMCIWVL